MSGTTKLQDMANELARLRKEVAAYHGMGRLVDLYQDDLVELKSKHNKLYNATNEMLARLGADGEVNTLTKEVVELMGVLHDLDGGVYERS